MLKKWKSLRYVDEWPNVSKSIYLIVRFVYGLVDFFFWYKV